MRLLIRILIFWAIALPIFYLFGLPWLTGVLTRKTRVQNYEACYANLEKQGLVGTPASLLKKEMAEHYCHCATDGLTFSRRDLFDLALRRPPTDLTAKMEPVVQACNEELAQQLNAVINDAPAPRITKAPDGTDTVHIEAPVVVRTTP